MAYSKFNKLKPNLHRMVNQIDIKVNELRGLMKGDLC